MLGMAGRSGSTLRSAGQVSCGWGSGRLPLSLVTVVSRCVSKDGLMKAWRVYGFNDMRLDDVPEPVLKPGHVIAKILCIQPSVTEAQLACGIPTLAYESIKRRLETEAPVQLFGHEFCA